MQNDVNKTQLFYDYYQQWIEVYKRGAIRDATMAKYLMTQKWVKKLVPELKVCELTRTTYQKLLNDYAKEHERQTTLDPACLTMTTESLTREFPLYTPSLLNLVKTSETHVKGLTHEG